MSNFVIADFIALNSSLQKIAQTESDPNTTRAIAIKRLQAIMGSNPNGVSTVNNAGIKSSDLKSIDSLLAFLKSNNVSFNGIPIVSKTRRSDNDEYWDENYIDKAAMTGYLQHLHEEIKDPINLPLLNAITSQFNQNIGLDYKPKSKDQAAPGQDKQVPSKPAGQENDLSKEPMTAPLPMNGDSIDFTRINNWLEQFKLHAAPQYKEYIQQVIDKLSWLTKSISSGWTPISLGGSPKTVFNNVYTHWLHANPTAAKAAANAPGLYFNQLSQFIGDIRGLLEAYKSQGLGYHNDEAIEQQFQYLQSAEIEVGTWVDDLNQIQQETIGANQ